MDFGQWLTQVFELVNQFGSLALMLKVSAILTLVISTFKISTFKPLWDKLGFAQMLIAPLLAFLLSIVNALVGQSGFSFNTVLGALVIGLTSVGFHQFLDALKQVPGVGPVWQGIIDAVENLLGGKNNTVRLEK